MTDTSHSQPPASVTISRRRILTQAMFGAFMCASVATFADDLMKTPAQTEGPFYPDKLPLDTDNDLLVINDGITPAVGSVTYLSGRVLDLHGSPIRDATVEIWQADNNGVYIHTGSIRAKRDANFQGFGRFSTGSTGEYLFRTIKPVAYSGRTPHIHVAVKLRGRQKWTTECYIKGDPGNDKDGVLRSIQNPKERAALIVPFIPIKDSKVGALAARFDIVMGFTPTE